MKIEVGESLMLSWLRHAKNCQLVQLNWKPSPSSWELHNENELRDIMEKADELFKNQFQLNIFKKNTHSSLLKQAEIDALGVEFNSTTIENIYGIDVAFHENGLNYGSKDETAARVIKKMIRTAMVIYGYFNLRKGNIIFASPKIGDNIYAPLSRYVDELNEFMGRLGFHFYFKIYGNERFREKIFYPVINLSSLVADTSELFMRSIQMYNMFGETLASKNVLEEIPHDFKGSDELKIGLLVRTTIKQLVKENSIPPDEVEKLLNLEYSKNTFNLNHPFLKRIDSDMDPQVQRQVNGYYRYWADEIAIFDNKYYVCKEWYEQNRNKFIMWLEKINQNSGEKGRNKHMPQVLDNQ